MSHEYQITYLLSFSHGGGVSCGLAQRPQLHSLLMLTQVCYRSRKSRKSLPVLSFLCFCLSVVGLSVYVTVTSTWAPVAFLLQLWSQQQEGGGRGAGIRRPELALVIHAKATPSVTSLHLLCPSLPLHLAVALCGLSLSHLLEEETEQTVLPHTLKHKKKDHMSYGYVEVKLHFMDFIMWLKHGI